MFKLELLGLKAIENGRSLNRADVIVHRNLTEKLPIADLQTALWCATGQWTV